MAYFWHSTSYIGSLAAPDGCGQTRQAFLTYFVGLNTNKHPLDTLMCPSRQPLVHVYMGSRGTSNRGMGGTQEPLSVIPLRPTATLDYAEAVPARAEPNGQPRHAITIPQISANIWPWGEWALVGCRGLFRGIQQSGAVTNTP